MSTNPVSAHDGDAKHLNWIADRLVHVYGESPNVDFVLRLREIADRLAAANAVGPGEVAMPLSDANDLDEVVHELGIEDSDTTPAEAVRKLKNELRLMKPTSDVLAALIGARELIDTMTFNVPKKSYHAAVMKQLDAAILNANLSQTTITRAHAALKNVCRCENTITASPCIVCGKPKLVTKDWIERMAAKEEAAEARLAEAEREASEERRLIGDLRARIATLTEAAKPFLLDHEPWMDRHADDVPMSIYARVTFGQYRALRAALHPEKASDPITGGNADA